MDAITVLTHPELEAFATFVSKMTSAGAGARWADVQDVLAKRVLPLASDMRRDVARAEAQVPALDSRHQSNIEALAAVREQLATLEAAVAAYPAQRAEIEATPDRVREAYAADLTGEEIAKVATALALYVQSLK
jgi:hypothetical protein